MGLGLGIPFSIGALEELVAKRRGERIQDESLAFGRKHADEQLNLQRRQQDISERMRQEQIAATEAFRQAAQESLNQQRAFGQVQSIAEHAMPGDPVDAGTKDLLTKYGMGGQIRTIAAQPAGYLQDGDVGPVDEQPEQNVMRGGSRYLQAAMQQQEATSRASVNDANADATRAETMRHNKAMEGAAQTRANNALGADVGGLTPQALDMTAKAFARTNQLPSFGNGRQAAALKKAVIDRAAQYDPNTDSFSGGTSPDLAANAAEYGANKQALGALQKNYSATQAFIGTMDRNLDLLNQVAKKVTDTGIPFLNAPLRQAANAMGSAEQASFNVLMQSVQGEAARILSNPTLAGQLTDTARREMQSVIAGGATVGQLLNVAQTLRQEAGNRASEFESQMNSLKGGTRASRTPIQGTVNQESMGSRQKYRGSITIE